MPLSVKDFDAIGDGVTDDTNAFEECLTLAARSRPEKAVFVPEGRYRLTRTLTPIHGPVKYLYGVHRDLSILVGDFPGYLIEGYNSTHMVRDLGFTSSATTSTGAVTMGIDLSANGCHFGVYENLRFERLRQSILIGGNSWTNAFRDIFIQSCGRPDTYAIDAKGDGSNSLSFHNLTIQGAREWPGRGGHFRGYGITFSHLNIEQIFHKEAAVFAVQGCSVNGGYLEHGLNNDDWPQNPIQTPPPLHQIHVHYRTTFNGVLVNCMVDTSQAHAHFIGCDLFADPQYFLPFGNFSTTNCNF